MAKAVADDIAARGWVATSFGSPPDWNDQVERLLDRAGRWAEAKLGATAYAAASADTYACDLLVRAECCWCDAELWRRRVSHLDAAANIELGTSQASLQAGYRANAQAAADCAAQLLDEAADALGVTRPSEVTSGGLSVGHVETGRFPQSSSAALNYGGAQ